MAVQHLSGWAATVYEPTRDTFAAFWDADPGHAAWGEASAGATFDDLRTDRESYAPHEVREVHELDAVARFLADADEERSRLAAELEAERSRARVAASLQAARALDARAQVEALVLAAREQLRLLEDEHRTVIESIRGSAEAEAALIVEAARTEAEAIRRTGVLLSDLLQGRGEGPAPG